MIRRNALVFSLAALFVMSVFACSKKQTTDLPQTDPDTEVTSETDLSADDTTENPVTEDTTKEVKIPVIDDVYFDFDKSLLTSAAKRNLRNNARQLKGAPSVRISIEGHCDERGTTAYNLALGERRAKAARDYLVSLGVTTRRMKTISYGEERPFATGHTEQAWELNRRAHFVITSD